MGFFGGGFNPHKCKTHLRLAIGRIRLLRNKKQVGMQGLRREIAELLAAGKEDSARIRVESVHREENLLVAFELLELVTVRGCLAQKYSKEFAMQCNSPVTCEEKGVSTKFVQALSVAAPSGAQKFDLLVGIAAEFGVAWDADEAAVRIMGSLHQAIGAPPDPEEVDQLADELVAAAQEAVRLGPPSTGEERAGTSAAEEDALTAALARQGLESSAGDAGPRKVSEKPVYRTAAEVARQEALAGGRAGGGAAKPVKPAPTAEDSSSLDGLSKRFAALKKR